MKSMQERALVFECRGESLLGILHEPVAAGPAGLGVLVLVGGPQYRAGSHRQFVVLARALAAAGHPVLRFDHRGIGDSDGAPRSFEELDDDISAAVDALFAARPGLDRCVIFGLCDAASAAMMYCPQDRRLAGLILANPWVHSEAGVARAYVKHYYLERLLQASFWRKVAAGEFDVVGSLSDLLRKLWLTVTGSASAVGGGRFQDRMVEGLRRFQGRVLLLISGRDLTAAEFTDLCGVDERWRAELARPGVERRDYPESDHTFSDARGLAASVEHCTAWLGTVASR
jgi:exosortase A-associated hydrolase 1